MFTCINIHFGRFWIVSCLVLHICCRPNCWNSWLFSATLFAKFFDASSKDYAANLSGWGSTTVTLFHSQPLISSPDPVCSDEDMPDKGVESKIKMCCTCVLSCVFRWKSCFGIKVMETVWIRAEGPAEAT